MSFLASSSEMRSYAEAAGFRTIIWRDSTEQLHQARQKLPSGSKAAGVTLVSQVLFGDQAELIMGNARQNTLESRVGNIVAVLERQP